MLQYADTYGKTRWALYIFFDAKKGSSTVGPVMTKKWGDKVDSLLS